MRRTVPAAVLALALAGPVAAQGIEDAPEIVPEPDGPSLMERGLDLMMRGLMQEMAPAIDEIEGAMNRLRGVVGQLDQYEAPEVLPNGDILIRRRPSGAPDAPEITPEEGEVEL